MSSKPEPLVAHPIYHLDQTCIATIDPMGYWFALVTDHRQYSDPQPRQNVRQEGRHWRGNTLSFYPLPPFIKARALPQSVQPLPTARNAKTLLQAIALNSRHLAVISDGPQPQREDSPEFGFSDGDEETSCRVVPPDPSRNRATYIEIFTRRGTRLASHYLPMLLGTVVTTPMSYRLLATDQYDAESMLCIDLKPFRIQRFALNITPSFLAATAWGYIAADVHGKILLLDTGGFVVSALQVPSPVTAMTILPPHLLLVATWDGNTGSLYTLDLKQQSTHWVF